MTRRDYVLIAVTLRGVKANFNSSDDELHGVIATIDEIATALQRDNPAFDRERFLADCGITD